MQISQPGHYTIQDYFQWPDDLRCELIHGEVYDMAPAPTLAHQEAVGALYALLREQLVGQGRTDSGEPSCRIFVAPVDVVLAKDTVVQPDLAVVCDAGKLESGHYVDGAPDLVVEVISSSTVLKDRREKRALYEAAGVMEYLLIDPVEHYAEIYRLNEQGHYGPSELWGPEDPLRLMHFPELITTLSELFSWPVGHANGEQVPPR